MGKKRKTGGGSGVNAMNDSGASVPKSGPGTGTMGVKSKGSSSSIKRGKPEIGKGHSRMRSGKNMIGPKKGAMRG